MSGLDVLLKSPRYEVIPAKGTEQAVTDWIPAGMTVTVTASPVKGLDPTAAWPSGWPPGATGWCRTWPPARWPARRTWTPSWRG